ncbi:hypothetical protein FOPG_17278 [Fusarium oxysporum f. sp. conglutinans race 2 54008]|uniref:Uncharacterized protein n=1 Tax=Fusarium oxysporum f. sp. conglutinans race 2 54008 TaxID=1089457 RepID=X0GSE9_FUSOX|nr:hypothetical protein FOPG_17278 [Fusarium oxysporum f. sp. conglutinans race 2 54008]
MKVKIATCQTDTENFRRWSEHLDKARIFVSDAKGLAFKNNGLALSTGTVRTPR